MYEVPWVQGHSGLADSFVLWPSSAPEEVFPLP